MITLEEACEIYTKEEQSVAEIQGHVQFPIGAIREAESEWVFFPDTDGGFYGAYIPTVNKETGEIGYKNGLDYDELPDIPIPEAYIKDSPAKRVADPFEDLFSSEIYNKYFAEDHTEELPTVACIDQKIVRIDHA